MKGFERGGDNKHSKKRVKIQSLQKIDEIERSLLGSGSESTQDIKSIPTNDFNERLNAAKRVQSSNPADDEYSVSTPNDTKLVASPKNQRTRRFSYYDKPSKKINDQKDQIPVYDVKDDKIKFQSLTNAEIEQRRNEYLQQQIKVENNDLPQYETSNQSSHLNDDDDEPTIYTYESYEENQPEPEDELLSSSSDLTYQNVIDEEFNEQDLNTASEDEDVFLIPQNSSGIESISAVSNSESDQDADETLPITTAQPLTTTQQPQSQPPLQAAATMSRIAQFWQNKGKGNTSNAQNEYKPKGYKSFTAKIIPPDKVQRAGTKVTTTTHVQKQVQVSFKPKELGKAVLQDFLNSTGPYEVVNSSYKAVKDLLTRAGESARQIDYSRCNFTSDQIKNLDNIVNRVAPQQTLRNNKP